MASNFPATSIDSFTTKVDSVDYPKALDINDLQNAVVAIETKLGIDDSAVNSSVDYKLSALRAGEKAVEVGDIKQVLGAAAGAGWLLMNGNTIGDGSSGGTLRADADTAELFAYIWTNLANSEAPIYDSTGSASTRGASAVADFAAHKRLVVPDARGAALVMYKASDTNFGALGKKAGAATHPLQTTEIPAHLHTVDPPATATGGQSATHHHTVSGTGGTDNTNSSEFVRTDNQGGYYPPTDNASNDHTHTVNIAQFNSGNAGGGGAHNNVQLSITVNFVIKY